VASLSGPFGARGRRPVVRGGLETRARITAAASGLLRRRGYAATGVNEVVAASDAPKGSLYHYFPEGKEQLASEAIERSGRIVSNQIERVLAASDSMPHALRRFAGLLASNLERSDFRDGCPVGTTTLEMAAESGSLQHACGQSFEAWTEVIAARLRDEGRDPQGARRSAVLILSAFEGALMMARALRDVTPLHEVAEELIEGGTTADRLGGKGKRAKGAR
jgi:TetR/AcrR family transcriptional regulator, lmrAB and yxaGH operons repressor